MELRKNRSRQHLPSSVWKTPILDQCQDVPISPFLPEESDVVRLIRLCISGCGLLCILGLNCCLGQSGILVTVCAIFAAEQFCVAIHEAGHLLAGILFGRTCQSFAVGPVSVSREGTRWRFRFSFSAVHVAGRTIMLPLQPGVSVAKDLIILASGPAANGLTFIACLVLRNFNLAGSSFWLWPLAITSAIGVLDSLIPSRNGEIESDGARMISLLRGDGIVHCVNADLRCRLLRGERPRSWDPSLIERATKAAAQPMQHVTANWLGYVHASDLGQPDAAARYLETVLTHCYDADSKFRLHLFQEAAFFQARHRGNPDLAISWFARAEQLRQASEGRDNSVFPHAVLLGLEDRIAPHQRRS